MRTYLIFVFLILEFKIYGQSPIPCLDGGNDSTIVFSCDTAHYIEYRYCKLNGNIISKHTMLVADSGLADGPYAYYVDGIIELEGKAVLGKYKGVEIRYFKNGLIKEINHYINDSLRYNKKFSEKGTILFNGSLLYSHGYGICTFYYTNGVLMKSGNFNVIEFSKENWQFIEKYNLKLEYGEHISYEQGPWTYYKEDGSLEKIINYDNGKVINVEEFK